MQKAKGKGNSKGSYWPLSRKKRVSSKCMPAVAEEIEACIAAVAAPIPTAGVAVAAAGVEHQFP